MGSQRAVRERQLSSESRISLNRLLLAGCCHLRNTSEYLPGAPSRERHGQFPEVPSFAPVGELNEARTSQRRLPRTGLLICPRMARGQK